MPRLLLSLSALALTFLLLVAASLSAHEIKALASNQSLPEGGGKTTVYLSWGHRLPVDELIDAATLDRYELLDPTGKGSITLKAADKSLQTNVVEPKTPGIHQVAVVRKPSVFTYVLDEDGARQLKRGGKSAHSGAKIDHAMKSQQTAKALIVVGKPSDKAPSAAGLPIEIVPLDGPASWTANSTLRMQVLRDGKPLTGAEVVARPIGFKPDNAWNYATTTNRKGEFTFKPSQAGTWVLKVHNKSLVQGKTREEYDFESFTTTLSLDIAP